MTKEELLKDISWGTVVKATTQKGQWIISEYDYAKKKDITHVRWAYNKCSLEKEESFDKIQKRAFHEGALVVYVVGHNCMSYSTIYTLTLDDNTEVYIKDTKDNTYIVFVE